MATSYKAMAVVEIYCNIISQPKHPWCSGQELKKGWDENDVNSNWAAKASCC